MLDILGRQPRRRSAPTRSSRRCRAREGKPVAPPTVYRTLDFLLEHGFLHKIESRNAYAPCEHLGHAHQGVLLLCEKCGRSDEIEDDAVMRAIAQAAGASHFRLKQVMVEAKGLCRRCDTGRTPS